MMFFAQYQLCFVGDDRVLLGPDKAVLWTLQGPAILAQINFEGDSGFFRLLQAGVWLPAASMQDTIPVFCDGATHSLGASANAGRVDRPLLARFHRSAPISSLAVRRQEKLLRPAPMARRGSADPLGWKMARHQKQSMGCGVWDVATGAKQSELEDGDAANGAINYTVLPDGTAVRAIDGDRIRLLRLPKLDLMRTIRVLEPHAYARIGVSPDGKQTIVIEGQCLAVYDHQPTEAIRSLLPPNFHEQSWSQKDVAPTGAVIGSSFDRLFAWTNDRADVIATYGRFSGTKTCA